MAHPDFPVLTYRPDLAVLTIRWLASADLHTSQAGYERLLEAPETSRHARWLLDVRLAPTPPPELGNWITYNWIPRAAARRAPGHLRLAYLLSAQREAAVRSNGALQNVVGDLLAPTRAYEVALFTDEAEAMGWLME